MAILQVEYEQGIPRLRGAPGVCGAGVCRRDDRSSNGPRLCRLLRLAVGGLGHRYPLHLRHRGVVAVRSHHRSPAGDHGTDAELHGLPVRPLALRLRAQGAAALWGAQILATGLLIALPMIPMLMFVNLMLGAISRVAPQINIFAVGLPVTPGIGLLGLVLTLPTLAQPFTMTLQRLLHSFG